MAARTWPALLTRLIAGSRPPAEDTAWAMNEIMTGEATPAQIAAFAVALRAKGETPSEVAGMAEAMLAHARRVELDAPAVDVVGTGGDQAGTVNISTMARWSPPRPGCRWSSTATGRRRRSAARPTCWRHSAW